MSIQQVFTGVFCYGLLLVIMLVMLGRAWRAVGRTLLEVLEDRQTAWLRPFAMHTKSIQQRSLRGLTVAGVLIGSALCGRAIVSINANPLAIQESLVVGVVMVLVLAVSVLMIMQLVFITRGVNRSEELLRDSPDSELHSVQDSVTLTKLFLFSTMVTTVVGGPSLLYYAALAIDLI